MSGFSKFLIAAPFLLILAGVLGYFNAQRSADPDRNNNEFAANMACENAVTQNLKAPSTAKFDSQATKAGEAWKVRSFVDAENSFGARIRTTYECTVIINEGTARTIITSLK